MQGPGRRTRYALLAALALATFAAYARALFCDFVYYDDGLYVFDNPFVRSGMTFAGLKHIFVTGETGTWQPLALLSHMIDCQLFGLRAWGHHLTSIVLHTANAVLLAIALGRLTGRCFAALATAAVFALHPAHVESVAWIAERKDVLSTLFWILCLLAYERYARRGGAVRYIAVVVLLALGLMAKPMLVTLPCVLLLLDYCPLRRTERGWTRLVIEKLPLFALAAASSIATLIVQRQNQAIVSLENLPLSLRFSNAAVSYVNYIALLIWPAGLAIDYPFPKGSLTVVRVVASCAVLGAVTLTAFAMRARAPYALVGWLWYLGTLVPVVGFVHVGEQGMADRYTYIPSIGLAIAAVWTFDAAAARARSPWPARAIAAAFACIALPAWSYMAWKQIGHWKNTESLWARAASVNPSNERAQRNLGAVYMERNDFARAVPCFDAARKVKPDDPRTQYNLGYALLRLGSPSAAVDPLANAVKRDPANVAAQNDYGVCLIQLNRDAEAIRVLEDAAHVETPDRALAANVLSSLALALAKTGRADDAKERLREALRLDPSNVNAKRNLEAMGG